MSVPLDTLEEAPLCEATSESIAKPFLLTVSVLGRVLENFIGPCVALNPFEACNL